MSFRLSPQQELVWSSQPEGPAGAGRITVEMQGSLDVDRLRQALTAVVERHEILRTTFARRQGMKTPLQVVHDALAPEWEFLDVSELAPEEQEARVAEAASATDTRRWDYADGPLVAGWLFARARDRFTLALAIASPCADGGSLVTIVRELAAHYAGDPVAEQPLQYADFAEWQNQLGSADDENADAGRQFWLEAAGTPSRLPFMRAAAPEATETAEVELDVAALSAAGEDYGVSAAALVQAAWHVVLWKTTGEDEVVVSTLTGQRAHAELESAVGAFARPFPVVSRPAGEVSAGEFAAQLLRSRAVAERWQDYSALDGLDSAVGFVETDAFEPISVGDVTFSCARAVAAGRPPTRGRMGRVGLPDPLHARRPRAHAGRARRALALARTRGDRRVATDLPRRASAARHRGGPAAHGRGKSCCEPGPGPRRPRALRGAAAVAADREAVVDEQGALTYAELDRRANQLAQRLRRAGVGPDSVVGLCTDRSTTMIIGLLGILKAGGAYLPLNFEHPPARLAHQLNETGAAVIVTQEALLGQLPDLDGEVVCLDRDRESLDAEPTDAPEVTVTPENLAYVHLHIGLDGDAEGRRCHARKPRQLRALDRIPPRGGGAAARVRNGDGDLHRSREHGGLPSALPRRHARAREPGGRGRRCRCGVLPPGAPD